MDVNYQITKIILIIIFWSLHGVIPEIWVFFICGLSLPVIELLIYKSEYNNHFPWELYLFYAYAFYGIFFPIETHFIFLGLGYMLARITVYFKLKSSINT